MSGSSGFCPFETYGAILKYEVGDHFGVAGYTIETSTFGNDSSRKATPGAGKCSAGGLQLGFD